MARDNPEHIDEWSGAGRDRARRAAKLLRSQPATPAGQPVRPNRDDESHPFNMSREWRRWRQVTCRHSGQSSGGRRCARVPPVRRLRRPAGRRLARCHATSHLVDASGLAEMVDVAAQRRTRGGDMVGRSSQDTASRPSAASRTRVKRTFFSMRRPWRPVRQHQSHLPTPIRTPRNRATGVKPRGSAAGTAENSSNSRRQARPWRFSSPRCRMTINSCTLGIRRA